MQQNSILVNFREHFIERKWVVDKIQPMSAEQKPGEP